MECSSGSLPSTFVDHLNDVVLVVTEIVEQALQRRVRDLHLRWSEFEVVVELLRRRATCFQLRVVRHRALLLPGLDYLAEWYPARLFGR